MSGANFNPDTMILINEPLVGWAIPSWVLNAAIAYYANPASPSHKS